MGLALDKTLHGFSNQSFGIDGVPVLCLVAVKERAARSRGKSSSGLVLPWENFPRSAARCPCELGSRAQPNRTRCVLGARVGWAVGPLKPVSRFCLHYKLLFDRI